MQMAGCKIKNVSSIAPDSGFIFFNKAFFSLVAKPLGKKAMANVKIYGITNWVTNNYNKHIARYLKKASTV